MLVLMMVISLEDVDAETVDDADNDCT